MSVQTIINNSVENLSQKALEGTVNNANKFILQQRFKLGNGYCEKDQFHNSIINEIMQITTCDLVNHINDIIQNGPKDCKQETSCKKKQCCCEDVEQEDTLSTE